MTDKVCFLLHHTKPLDFGTPPKLLMVSPSGTKITGVTMQILSEIPYPVVTHSFALLVEWFRKGGLKLPTQVLDLEIAKKLLVGRPKADYEAVFPWDMPSLLSPFLPARYDLGKFRAAFAAHLASPTPTNFGDIRAMVEIASKLPYLWTSVVSELKLTGEWTRYLNVEVPVYNLLLSMQYRGIEIDEEQRKEFLNTIEDQYIAAHHELAIELKVDVERAFIDTSYLSSLVKEPIEYNCDVKKFIKAKRNENHVCFLLHSVDRSRTNRRILLRTSVTNDRCFPIFDTMGTVSGRILAVDPRLQQLNRRYRGIIKAAPNCQLLYLDYSQFEPNIMASVSEDEKLLGLCAQDDLYAQMSLELWGTPEYRNLAKRMFLEYSYGKDEERLIASLAGTFGSQQNAEATIQERFVPLFFGIQNWKASVADRLLKNGRIGTTLGGYRYRTEKGELNRKERRWAVSQVVQGTGALILKRVMLAISEGVPGVVLLLPMFDALLMEIPNEAAAKTVKTLIECFENTFREVCPLTNSSVRIKPFACKPIQTNTSR
jgi:DNA polymerase I